MSASILIPVAVIGGDKWRRAISKGGSDAVVLLLALLRHAAANDTAGLKCPPDTLPTA